MEYLLTLNLKVCIFNFFSNFLFSTKIKFSYSFAKQIYLFIFLPFTFKFLFVTFKFSKNIFFIRKKVEYFSEGLFRFPIYPSDALNWE